MKRIAEGGGQAGGFARGGGQAGGSGGGDGQTVAAAGGRGGSFGSNITGLANLRMAVEVGDWEKNYFVLAGGQSGNPLSPHYDDQLKRWLRGQAIKIAWGEAAIAGGARATLALKPAR